MRYLYRIILAFCIAAVIMFLPPPAQAQQSSPVVNPKGDRTIQQSAEDLFKRGVYEALTGNYRVAIEDFTQVIHLRPDDATVYINQGIARAAVGERQKAIEDFNSALRLNPDLEVAYYNRGYVRFELQDYPGAIADFNRAIHLNPQDVNAYHCRCLVRHQMGDMQGVVEDLHAAEDLYLKRGKLKEYQGLLNNIKKLYSSNDSSVL